VTLGVAGVGLIGGSIVLRARQLGWSVGVYDIAPEHRRIALEHLGASFTAESLPALAARCETLAICAPLDATLEALATLAALNPPEGRVMPPVSPGDARTAPALVLDVASVKLPTARAGAAQHAFVATHPIAGSERSGPAAARADLFVGRVWTYDPAAAAVSCARAVGFIEAMGALPVPIASAEHDRIVALTSHLPQLLSVALGAALEPHIERPEVAALSGTGVRSMLRLAGSSWTVWEAVLRANASALAQEVRGLADILTGVASALETDAPDVLAQLFARAAVAADHLHRDDE
jgi:prephenate dehydrogenase